MKPFNEAVKHGVKLSHHTMLVEHNKERKELSIDLSMYSNTTSSYSQYIQAKSNSCNAYAYRKQKDYNQKKVKKQIIQIRIKPLSRLPIPTNLRRSKLLWGYILLTLVLARSHYKYIYRSLSVLKYVVMKIKRVIVHNQ